MFQRYLIIRLSQNTLPTLGGGMLERYWMMKLSHDTLPTLGGDMF